MPLPVITAPDQVHAWDAQTIAAQNITSLQLMERAARAFVDHFTERYPPDSYEVIDILCGPGNNGGDGAAIARLLEAAGYTTSVWGWWGSDGGQSPDLVANWESLKRKHHPRLHENEDYVPTPGVDVIIDALFGVGLTRPLSGAYAETVRTANEARAQHVAVDVPSGQKVDGSQPDWLCFDAGETVTFEALKLAALLPETGPTWGAVLVTQVDLEEPPNWMTPDTPVIIDRDVIVALAAEAMGPRERFTHKGTYGHVLVIAGSRGHAGAALLSGTGALNAGAGLVTFYVPARLETVMQLGLPEAMCLVDPHGDYLTTCPDLDRYDAFVIGPGIGQHADTARMLSQLFAAVGERPCVIDADALNLVAADETLSDKLPARAILTPHPGEFARLAGETRNGYERMQRLRGYAKTLPPRATVVLKDQYTAVATPDGEHYFNFFDGNPGMGTGGMGDVLAGVVGAIAARMDPVDSADPEAADFMTSGAAVLGVYAHAKAGDIVKEGWGEDGVTASRVAEAIGQALRRVYNSE